MQEVVEPLGKSEDVDSEVDPIEKEFDGEVLDEEALSEFAEREEQEIIEGIVEMVEKYIDDNHAILNNQLKKKIYSDVIPVNDKIKKGIKEALANHPRIKAHKLDKFRTLYYKGESLMKSMHARLVNYLEGGVMPITLWSRHNWFITIEAKIDTGADRSSLDIGLIEALEFKPAKGKGTR